MRDFSKVVLVLVGLLGFIVPRMALADDPIRALKDKAEADFKLKADVLKTKYLIALERLQKSRASAGDLTGAVAVKDEAARVKIAQVTLLASTKFDAVIDPRTAPTKRVTLMARDAQRGKGTIYDPTRALITGWSRTGAFAVWNLSGTKPGKYKVTLNFVAGNLGGGMFLLRTAKNQKEFSVAGTGKWDEHRQQVIGEFYLSGGDQLMLSAVKGSGREMIYVDTVELEPVR